MDPIPIIIDGKGNATPIILGGKGNMQKNAMEAFVKLQEDLGVQRVVIHSQSRLILELVRKFGSGPLMAGEALEIRLKKEMLMPLVATWELVTADDDATNELVLTARKSVDNNVNGKNSPTL